MVSNDIRQYKGNILVENCIYTTIYYYTPKGLYKVRDTFLKPIVEFYEHNRVIDQTIILDSKDSNKIKVAVISVENDIMVYNRLVDKKYSIVFEGNNIEIIPA